MGNRLSQHKITKVMLPEDPEDTGLEEGDEDNNLVDSKTTETGKGSPSSKKKWEPEPEPQKPLEQASLFAPPAAAAGSKQQKRQKRAEPEQADLFGEKEKKEVKSDRAFKPGETIEFDL